MFSSRCSAQTLGTILIFFLAFYGISPIVTAQQTDNASTWLDRDVMWRLRNQVVYHLVDDAGDGFDLTVFIRDMNVYDQGPRTVTLFVEGPQGRTLVNRVVPDDGIESGNAQYHDGTADVYMDFRYREWHRMYSPGERPPNKRRSPMLKTPERLTPRTVELKIPAAGPGLYRVFAIGGWDHWISMEADRPLACGIHPGPGPLYCHGDQLKSAWFYAPEGAQGFSVSTSEEIQPFNWSAVLEDENGKRVAATEPKNFFNFMILDELPADDAVYRLRVTGKTTGACLHLGGVPFVLCPDAATARKIEGGVRKVVDGRWVYHADPLVLYRWAKGLKADDLAVNLDENLDTAALGLGDWTPAQLEALLDSQDLDPASPRYGGFAKMNDPQLERRFSKWNRKGAVLAALVADKPGNPLAGNPAIVRRIVLSMVDNYLRMNPYFWLKGSEGPSTFERPANMMFGPAFRSQWVPMHELRFLKSLIAVKDGLDAALPAEVVTAVKRPLEQWSIVRTNTQQGECSNQWCAFLKDVADAYRATDSPAIEAVLRRQIGRITTPGVLGRVGPDPTPYSTKSKTAYTYAADSGLTGAGFLSDGLGHDAEYCLESTLHLGRIFQTLPDERIAKMLSDYYVLKTHLTLPKQGDDTRNAFSQTVSPTDSNHRTRFYTHKSPLPDILRPAVRYGDLWGGAAEVKEGWPCNETEPFVRNIDNRYYFVNTPGYYAAFFTGPANYEFASIGEAVVEGDSIRLAGYRGMHYGGFERLATKIGGISAVYVRGCGPTLLCQNHNVMYSNGLWGRRTEPVSEVWEKGHVDPEIVCEGFATPSVEFDEKGRVCRRTARLRFAPLAVTRTIVMKDDRIEVTVDVLATDDVNLRELYESIPFFADNRDITVYGDDLKPVDWTLPEKIHAKRPPSHLASPPEYAGEDPALPEVTLRALDIAAENGGPGTLVVFDRAWTAKQVHPVRYREVAAATGSFNLPLPKRMAVGERLVFRYTLLSHARPLTPERIRQAAEAIRQP
jgi:hypothetical protein